MDIKTPELGILEWFSVGDKKKLEQFKKDLKKLKIKKVRTGVSWLDWSTEEGKEWLKSEVKELSEEFDLLPCFNFTPPALGIKNQTSSPPKDLEAFARFLDEVLKEFADSFPDGIELWNEHNYPTDWDRNLDPKGEKFARMIKEGSKVGKKYGKKIILGGMNRVDLEWIDLIGSQGIYEEVEVVGIHGLQGTGINEFLLPDWSFRIKKLKEALKKFGADKKEIWLTEVGYSTFDPQNPDRELKQLEVFVDALSAPVERVYWYSLYDLPSDQSALEEEVRGRKDTHQYFFGLKDQENNPKQLWKLLEKGGIKEVENFYADYYLQKSS